ncbi:MAG: hypothetical protein KC503_38225 [Myxococcales bacterium]|nr:hypothetical protein [Myxococcales bacterium]
MIAPRSRSRSRPTVTALALALALLTPTAHGAPTSQPTSKPTTNTTNTDDDDDTERARRGLIGRLLFGKGGAPSTQQQPARGGKSWLGPSLVRRGIFDRPYLTRVGQAVAIGGYIDMLGAYQREQGIDSFGFEARRFNIFVSSAIADFIRLTSELEFEHGTEEIALETALVDIRFHHVINLRAGVLLVPLGRFNVAHDSPIYDLVDRPLVSTRIIPATFSEIGVGLFGFLYPGRHTLTYEAYLVNGLGAGLLSADGTRISAGRSPERFAFDENSSPAVTGRIGWSSPFGLDLGVSMYAGVYNKLSEGGERVASRHVITILALDYELRWRRLTIRGEAALALIDVPPTLAPEFAEVQWGFYSEAVVKLLQRPVLVFPKLGLFAVARVDFVDLNVGTQEQSDRALGEETTRLSLGISLRPAPPTSLRLVYYHEWSTDALGNRARAGAIQLGLASYF